LDTTEVSKVCMVTSFTGTRLELLRMV